MKPASIEDEAEKLRRFEEATAGITGPFLLYMEREAPGFITTVRAMLRTHEAVVDDVTRAELNKSPI